MLKAILTFFSIAAIAGVVAMAGDQKEIPNHAGFQSCQSCHAEMYSMWEASGHSKALSLVVNAKQALSLVVNAKQASADCYSCHSAEGFAAKLQGKKVDISQKESFNTLSCVACHDPHKKDNPHMLVMDPEKLCNSCHTQEAVLKGKGAKGIEETRSWHSAVACVSCHMTGGNHLMKVIRPDDPGLSEKRIDSCTACHKDNNREARAAQIKEWQATYKENMDPLQADVKAISASIKEKPDLLNAGLKTKFNDARTNLSILTRDGSRGVHNLDYAMEIMALAARDLHEVKAALK